jgi:hypothetical protein
MQQDITGTMLKTDYDRIKGNAADRCPQCQSFIAGMKTVWAGKAAREKQAALAGAAETRAEQRLQRQLHVQLRSADDYAVRQLVQQRNETINAFIARQASVRAQAERQVRANWKARAQAPRGRR